MLFGKGGVLVLVAGTVEEFVAFMTNNEKITYATRIEIEVQMLRLLQTQNDSIKVLAVS